MADIQIIQHNIPILFFFLWSIIGCYFLIMLIVLYGWNRTNSNHKEILTQPVKVSVIIAARDEDQNIQLLLSDLEKQTYSTEFMEWIVIDDHSLNKIADLSGIKRKAYQNLTIIDLDNDLKGKKEALIAGVNRSSGELLLFTDADCRLNKGWIESFVNKYLQEKAGMIIGLVDYFNSNGFLRKFFRFDLLGLVVTGSGLANIGIPVMCNGANLAVRADLYKNNIKNIKPEISTGDDIFMLHAIKKDRFEKIVLLKTKKSVVLTNPPNNLNEFISQRSRWASKSTSYNDMDTLILASVVLLTNLMLMTMFINCLISGSYTNIILMFAFKLIGDGLIIASGLTFFGGIKNLILLPVFSIFYPFYILITVVRSIFKIFIWKGRRTSILLK
jgi:poly-beta-1,6-N-acetyl-D-glucosamine synthase